MTTSSTPGHRAGGSDDNEAPITATDSGTSPNSTSSSSNNSPNTSPRGNKMNQAGAIDEIIDRNDENDNSKEYSSRPQQQQQQHEVGDDDHHRNRKSKASLPSPDRELGPKYVDSSYLLTIPEEERIEGQSVGGSSVAGDIGIVTSLPAIPRRRGPGTVRSATSSTGAMMITEDDDDTRLRSSKRPLPSTDPKSGVVAKTFRNLFGLQTSQNEQEQQHPETSQGQPTMHKPSTSVVVDSSSTFDMNNSPDLGSIKGHPPSGTSSSGRKSSGTRKREEEWKKQQEAKTTWYDFARKNQTYLIVIAASCLIVVIGIIVGIVLRNSSDNPSSAEAPDYQVLLDTYLNGFIANKVYPSQDDAAARNDYYYVVFNNTSTPQYQARQWLLYNDTLLPTALSQGPIRFLQRYALVVMYYGMNGQYWSLLNSTTTSTDDEPSFGVIQGVEPTTTTTTTSPYYFLLPTVHECEWTGVYCTSEWYDDSYNDTRTESDLTKNFTDTTTATTDDAELSDPQQRRRRVITKSEGHVITEQLRRRWYESEIEENEDDNDDVYAWKSWRRYLDTSGSPSSIAANISTPDDIVLRVWMPRSNLTGTIPIDITAMDSLRDLDLSENQLQGSISDRFVELLSDITLFDLSFNDLTGTIPSVLWTLPALSKVYLNDNNLTGRISDVLPGSSSLSSSTSTSGSTKTLEKVWIQNNHITGPLPSWFTKLTNLRVWIAFNNNITGPLPSTTLPPLVEYLDFSNNQLSGSIPVALWTLPTSPEYLSHLYLDNNRLSSTLPPTFANLYNLQKVWLHNNDFSGAIPFNFAQVWKNLIELTLHGNTELTGILGPDLSAIEDQFAIDMNVTAYNEAMAAQCGAIWPAHELILADCFDRYTSQPPNVSCSCCTYCPQ